MDVTDIDMKNFMLHHVHFASVLEFLNYIETAPLVCRRNQSSRTGTYQFTNTHNYEQAFDMCKNGYFDESVRNFQQKFMKIKKQLDKKTNLTKTKHDLQGFVPDIPEFLTGNPMNMINADYANRAKKPTNVTINYNVATFSDVPTSSMEKRGLAALIMYQILNNLKFNVKFTNTQLVDYEKNLYKLDIDLIKKGDILNLSKLYFPLVHPSFLRRLIFAFEERDPFLQDKQDFFYGYGHPITIAEYTGHVAPVTDSSYYINTDEFSYGTHDLKTIVKTMIISLGEQGLFKDDTQKLLDAIDEIDFSAPESISDDENFC